MVSEIDVRILEILQRDGRISNQNLAEKAGLSTSSCWRRVRDLEAGGQVRRYGAMLDSAACGLNFLAIVQVILSRHEPDKVKEFAQAVQGRKEVVDCYATTGDADYHMRVCCRDKEDYNRFLEDFLFRIPVVANVRTNLILREIKHEAPLPLQW